MGTCGSVVTDQKAIVESKRPQSRETQQINEDHNEKSDRRNSNRLFYSELRWTDLRFHSSSPSTIYKPNELMKYLEDPPKKPNAESLCRIRGSIFGLALGDALGASVEFRPYQFLKEHPVKDLQEGGTWGLAKGQFTDDTSMALCLGISLITRRDFVPYDQLVRYKWWHQHGYMSSTGICFDIGQATSSSLTEFSRRQKKFAKEHKISLEEIDYLSDPKLLDEFDIYCSDERAAGNGSLMRLAPVPLFFHRYPEHAVDYSGVSGQITHGDPLTYDICCYYGALIVAAVQGESKEEILHAKFYQNRKQWFRKNSIDPRILKVVEDLPQKEEGYEAGIRGKGFVLAAFEAALWAFKFTKDFESGALAVVNLGDDTDTTAAIYGQLAGAYYGYDELPSKWLKHVYAREYLDCLCKWIAYEGDKWEPTESES